MTWDELKILLDDLLTLNDASASWKRMTFRIAWRSFTRLSQEVFIRVARNKYPGRCYCCGKWIEPGYGHFEKILGSKPGEPKWRIKCVKCASGRNLTAEDPGVKWAQSQNKSQQNS